MSEAKEISCERFSNFDWGTSIGTVKTCYTDRKQSIQEHGVTFSTRNETVKALSLGRSENIIYLPDNVAQSFPNLGSYGASDCSLKDIAKRNFNGLIKLKYLGLARNQIEKITTDTSEGLVTLEKLWLGKKKSTFLFSRLFISFLLLQLETKSSPWTAQLFEDSTN